MDLREIFVDSTKYLNTTICLDGWVRNHCRQKGFGFIDFSDGTCFKHLQIVYDTSLENFDEISKVLVGSALHIEGKLVESRGNQEVELQAVKIDVVGTCPEDYPIQPKRHTREFLRSVAYLRPRTNLFQAVFRVRSVAAFAIQSRLVIVKGLEKCFK